MMNRLCLIGVLAMVGAGCGGAIDYVVDPDYLKEVSREGQRWIYDAENEIVVALDKLDEAKDIRLKTRRRIKEAEKAVERAEKRNQRLGVEVAEAWLSYLEALEEWVEENIDIMRLGVVVARATVELAKAQVINREDLLGGKGFAIGRLQGAVHLAQGRVRQGAQAGQEPTQARAQAQQEVVDPAPALRGTNRGL